MPGTIGGRIRLAELNDQLTCKLCRGYFIDATTIVECLHSFCKSCIVKYLKKNKYCPICEVLVHECKPLLGIKPDYTLQDIVYKLVPSCYQNEMRCRREFYDKYPEAKIAGMSPEARGEPIESHIYSADELLNLSLEYYNPTYIKTINIIPILKQPKESEFNSEKNLSKIYLRCPAAVTVYHLQKLIRAKYELSDEYRIDFMYKEESLCTNYTLMDVMYIYHWRRKVPLNLNYRIFKSYPKRLASSDEDLSSKENGKIENECKKSNTTKDSSDDLSRQYSSDENSNAAITNVPMITDSSDEPQREQDSVDTTSTSIIDNSHNNNVRQEIVTTTTTTTSTTMTTTISASLMTATTITTQANQPCSSVNPCSVSNTSGTLNLNSNDTNNNKNNNDNSNISGDRGSLSAKQESSKVDLKTNTSIDLPQSNTTTSAILKPITKKIDLLPKGTTFNKICTKINNSGSKINDICSKIRNFSKKKSKVEKIKSGVPMLLKVTKKSVTSTPDDVVKRISTIPIVSPHSSDKSTNNDPDHKLVPTTTTSSSSSSSSSSISTTFEGSGLVVSDKLSKTLETQSFNQSSSDMMSSSGSIQLNSTVESPSSHILSPNTSGVNESISGVRKKPPIAKPPRLFKTKPLPKYQGNQDISIKPLLNNDDDMKDKGNSHSKVLAPPNKVVTPAGLSSMPKHGQDTITSYPSANVNSSSSYLSQKSYHHLPFTPVSSSSSSYPANSSAFMPSTNPFTSTAIPNITMKPNYSQLPSSGYTNNDDRYSNSLFSSSVQVPTSNAIRINMMPVPRNIKHNTNDIVPTATVHYRPGLTIRPVFSSSQVPSINNYTSLAMAMRRTGTNLTTYGRRIAPAISSENKINSNKGNPQDSSAFNFSMASKNKNFSTDFSKRSNSSSSFENVSVCPTSLINPMKSYESDTKVQEKTKREVENNKKGEDGRQELNVICSEIEKKSEKANQCTKRKSETETDNTTDKQSIPEKVDKKIDQCSSVIENSSIDTNKQKNAVLSRNDAEIALNE